MFDFILGILHIIFGAAVLFVAALLPVAPYILIVALTLMWVLSAAVNRGLFGVIKETIQKRE